MDEPEHYLTELPLGVLVLNENNSVIWVNRKLCRQLGYTRANLEGTNVGKLIAPEDGIHLYGIDEALRSKEEQELTVLFLGNGGRPTRLLTYTQLLEDGRIILSTRAPGATEKFLEESSRWAADEKERADELAVARDKLAQANEEMQAMQQDLIRASRLAGRAELAAGVLHNIGNVLNSVNVTSNMLQERLTKSRMGKLDRVATVVGNYLQSGDEQSPEKNEKFSSLMYLNASELLKEQQSMLQDVASLLKKVEHMRTIVDAQQEYARAGGVLEVCNLERIVGDAVDLQNAAASSRGLDFKYEFASIDDFEMDRHRVLQILTNLIKNAAQAVQEQRPNGGQIVVSSEPTGDGMVALSVTDNGVGISDKNLQRIFSHGYSSKKDGHGFGLHSAALTAKEMGGSLSALSEGEGQGATFILTIPLKPANDTSKKAG